MFISKTYIGILFSLQRVNAVRSITTAAENEEQTPKRAESGLTGWIECYPKSRLAGTLFCGDVNSARDIEGNPKLDEAFELGKKV